MPRLYSDREYADMHYIYGLSNGNASFARDLYQRTYPRRNVPDRSVFVRIDTQLCKTGTFCKPKKRC
ncbi:hypothetical protein M0804_015417 [Polistes exclamans]|nr:hypothetical protein M0804_015417 [Polistes exclamans]